MVTKAIVVKSANASSRVADASMDYGCSAVKSDIENA